MSISTEITRLQTLRNNIRTKLINLGVFSNSSASLQDCYTALNGIAKQTSATVSGATVSVAGGYHNGAISGTVASGTQGTPSASKSISGNTATITPSCTDTTGYISGSTKTGTAVTVSASELVSGSESITENGTYDVTNKASAVVNVPSPNARTYKVTLDSDVTLSAAGYIILTDADLGAVCNESCLHGDLYMTSPANLSLVNALYNIHSGNFNAYKFSSSVNYCNQAFYRNSTNSGAEIDASYKMNNTASASKSRLSLDSSGNLRVHCNGTKYLAAGTYMIIIAW